MKHPNLGVHKSGSSSAFQFTFGETCEEGVVVGRRSDRWAYGAARVTYVVTFTQDSQGVTAIGSGSINTAGLSGYIAGAVIGDLNPSIGSEVIGPPLEAQNLIRFGRNLPGVGSSGPGNAIGVGSDGMLQLPIDYGSGGPLSDQASFADATFASLGLSLGLYVAEFGVGADHDSYAVLISPPSTPVPKPASLALLAMGVAGIAAVRPHIKQ